MDLIGAEIFASGKWNDLEFSDEDLDDIVANFEKLSDIHKVPLKLGHNDEQKVTDGQPALGWVSRVYRKGQKLLADFVDMPKVVYDAIKKKLYRTVSVELLFNVNHKNEKYNHVLDAVALLGADHPAVNTLADLETLIATRTEFSGGRRLVFETNAGKLNGKQTKEDPDMGMTKEEVKELLASAVDPLKEEISSLKDENKALKSEKEKLEKEQADFAKKQKEEKIELRRKEINKILDAAVNEEKMLPAVRETYSKQIGLDNDERVLDIDVEQVKIMCDATGTKLKDGESGMHKGQETYDNPEEELLNLTHKNMADTGETDFSVAFSRVSRANPKLHKAYLDMNGVKRDDRA